MCFSYLLENCLTIIGMEYFSGFLIYGWLWERSCVLLRFEYSKNITYTFSRFRHDFLWLNGHMAVTLHLEGLYIAHGVLHTYIEYVHKHICTQVETLAPPISTADKPVSYNWFGEKLYMCAYTRTRGLLYWHTLVDGTILEHGSAARISDDNLHARKLRTVWCVRKTAVGFFRNRVLCAP